MEEANTRYSFGMNPPVKDARFYFANLAVDVGRCVSALQKGDSAHYETHLAEAYKTLKFLRNTKNAAAYEEGELLIRGLDYARELGTLSEYSTALDNMLIEYSPLVQ
jgi:hypothetical protein